MDAERVAGVLLLVGSVVFMAGAAIAVPRVFTEPDPQVRLRMLEERPGRWRAGQPLYALGPVVAAVGAGYLAVAPAGTGTRVLLAAGGLSLLVGSLAWARSVQLRATRVREFALGTLPGWSFRTYVLLTNLGLGLVGLGLLDGRFPGWLGWLTLAADTVFLAAYLRFRDIPPFVFYLLLGTVGAVLL